MADEKKASPAGPSNKAPVATIQQKQADFVTSQAAQMTGYLEQRDAQTAAVKYQLLFGGTWTVSSVRGRWDVVRTG